MTTTDVEMESMSAAAQKAWSNTCWAIATPISWIVYEKMRSASPSSILWRIPPVSFDYCQKCECEDCNRVFGLAFCSRCCCHTCTTDKKEPYLPEYDQPPRSVSGKGKQKSSGFPISPVKRVKVDSVNTAVKKVDQPVPSDVDRFCLVSLGDSPEDCLETCHIVPRALSEDELQKLEFAWGLRYCGLYLHSRYNVVTLTAGLHASFDKASWALVPLDHFASLNTSTKTGSGETATR